jgi:polar amino acid transport system substrate-binding protein
MVSRREFAGLLATGTAAAGTAGTVLAGTAAAQTPPAAGSAGDTTFDRVMRTKKLRIGGISGGEPYYHKDLASGQWSGFCVDMAKDLASNFEAEVEIVETTWGNQVLDLQSGKIDIGFGLNPTPKRAFSVRFCRPLINNSFTILARKGFEGKSWKDLNSPNVKISVDIGSSHDQIAHRLCPNAQIIGFKTADEATLAVQTGRADCQILVVILSLTVLKKNPNLGKLVIPQPIVLTTTNAGTRIEPDSRFKDFVDNWVDYNRGLGQIRDWVVANLTLVGVQPDDIPSEVAL